MCNGPRTMIPALIHYLIDFGELNEVWTIRERGGQTQWSIAIPSTTHASLNSVTQILGMYSSIYAHP